jgi:4'-phosphopantetheinyl transferase
MNASRSYFEVFTMPETSSLRGAPFGLRDLEVRHVGVTLRLLEVAADRPQSTDVLSILSAEEQERAARFRSEEDRLRFTLTRAALRHLLAEIIGSAPEGLVFTTGSRGKPRLAGAEALQFNVSHSGSLSLIGISRERPIGVDIERKRGIQDLLGVAEAVFSEREYRALVELGPEPRQAAFFAIWTAKEAVLKALGTGIGEGTRDFSIVPSSRGLAVIAETKRFAQHFVGISLERPDVPENYTAAFALI